MRGNITTNMDEERKKESRGQREECLNVKTG